MNANASEQKTHTKANLQLKKINKLIISEIKKNEITLNKRLKKIKQHIENETVLGPGSLVK